MSLLSALRSLGAAWLVVSAVANTSLAETASSKGVGVIEFTNWFGGPDEATRREATERAKLNSLERYLAQGNQARLRQFDAIRDQVRDQIDDFVLSAAIVSEEVDKKTKQFSVVVHSEINVTRLTNALQAASAVMNASPTERSAIAMVFVAREQRSVKTFDERVHRREDVDQTDEGADLQAESAAGVEYAASSSRSTQTTTGGSVTRRADDIEYDVSTTGEINSAMLKVFSNAGFEVIEAEYAEEYSDGLLSPDAFRSDYRHGDDVSAHTLRNAVRGVKAIEVPFLAIGILDVGIRDIDPVSGLARIQVRVTGKIIDATGPIPKTIASVGPVQYAGIGSTETAAKTNGLVVAAEAAAAELVDQLNARGIR